MAQKNKKKQYDYDYIYIPDVEGLKEKIQGVIDKENHYKTMSSFIRDAVKEKINRIENPEAFNESKGTNKKIDLLSEKIDIMRQKIEEISTLKEGLEALQEEVKRPKIKEKEEKVVNILKEKGELSIHQLVKDSNLKEDVILEVLSNDSLFQFNIRTDGVRLKNDQK